MTRRTLPSAAALLMLAAGPGGSHAQAPRSTSIPSWADSAAALGADSSKAADRASSVAPFDMSGLWRLDPAQSDPPPPGAGAGESGGGAERRHGGRGEGGGGEGGGEGDGGQGGMYGGGHGGHGGHGGRGGWGGGEGGPGGPPPRPSGGLPGPRGPGRLPALIRIKQSAGTIDFADSTGATLVEITVNGSAPDTARMGGHVVVLPGQWRDELLEARPPSWRGSTLTQTFALEEDGERLVVRLHMDTGGVTPPTDVKRVYQKVGN